MRLVYAIGLLSFTFLLASCVSHQTTAIINTPPKPANLTAFQVRPAAWPKTVLKNTPTVLGGAWDINPDCSVRGIATTRVTQQPAHGEMVVFQQDDFPTYPPANPRSACNNKKLPGTFVKYTPAPDYVGQDNASIETIGEGGNARKFTFLITVE
jgi:hypothetical protein